jgi:hypothetical protein
VHGSVHRVHDCERLRQRGATCDQAIFIFA